MPTPSLDLVERLAEEMALGWRSGERPTVEDFLARHPELGGNREAALELLSEEISLRLEYGESVSASGLASRFPQWGRQVRALLDCHEVLAPLGLPRFPQAGERLAEFDLLAELGRGSSARVFLARQPSLAGRLVVLKLTAPGAQEHLALARLQHTHIVPLYSVHDFPGRNLSGLCQPWFGGATLDRLLAALTARPAERQGRDLLEALARLQSSEKPCPPERGAACSFLASASYVEAVCWLGACLADALQYAAERGLLHLDLKPSNVLLSADGQPMLLDFHLARGPLRAGQPAPPWLGGTPGYMAPEQVLALGAVARRQAVPADVDGRADVYALGLLLVELLAGERLESGEIAARFLGRLNPQVTPGLAALLGRCLEANPVRRYACAGEVAADLRRHLADLPLRGVRNLSLVERWRKWRRRRPHSLPFLGLLVLSLTAALFFVAHAARQADRARAALAQGEGYARLHRPAEAAESFRHGLALAEELPFQGSLRDELHLHLGRAEGARAAGELHAFCEQIRPLYATEEVAPGQLTALGKRCEQFWLQRDQLGMRLAEPGEALEAIRADLLDLAVLWAHLRVRASGGESAALHREALDLLAQAEEQLGRSCVLEQERSLHARALGLLELAAESARRSESLPPRSPWEHYAVGRAFFHAGDVKKAQGHLERALRGRPGFLWANFYQGCCAFREGQWADAVASFSVCVALAPQSAWCHYNRGLAEREAGRADRALLDFDRALELDPALGAALVARGALHHREGRQDRAVADLEGALRLGHESAAIHYHLALVYQARGEQGRARSALRRVLDLEPGHRQAAKALRLLPEEPGRGTEVAP